MIQTLINLSKAGLQYGLQFLAITGVQFLLFFMFAKYKTGLSFVGLWRSYAQLFVRALMFTLMLLFLVVMLTYYVDICSVAVVLLAISSLSIVLKYVDFVKAGKEIIFDLGIMLSNGYVMYALVTKDPVSVTHYLVLYAIVLCVFLYQRLKVVHQENLKN